MDRERNSKNDSALPFFGFELLIHSSNSEQNHRNFVGMTKKCDGSGSVLWFSSSASSLVLFGTCLGLVCSGLQPNLTFWATEL